MQTCVCDPPLSLASGLSLVRRLVLSQRPDFAGRLVGVLVVVFLSRIRLKLFFFSCFDYHLIIWFGYHLVFRGSFSVFVHAFEKKILVARKRHSKHTQTGEIFRYWRDMVPSR